MTLKLTKCVAALALAGLVAPAFAQESNLEFHGYFRGATGVNMEGGALACFGGSNAGSVYGSNGTSSWRLGKECDYVIEPNFIYTVAKNKDFGVWKVQFMPSIYRAFDIPSWNRDAVNADGTPTTTALIARYGQVFIRGENIPALGNGTVWGGRRFYDRVQLGINDEFLENHDGEGAGLEDIDVGVGKISYAFLT
ncbi:MAG: carbohydrate porin, partial [Pseudomonadota bacterium]